MIMKQALTIVFIFCLIGVGSLFAANDSANHDVVITINEVVLIDIAPDTTAINLASIAPLVGGDAVTGSSNSTKYLQYTSLVAGGTTREVQARLDALPTVTGVSVSLVSADPAGGPEEGTAGPAVTLSTVDQAIITAISSCATGTAATDGANLTYTLVIDDVSQLVVGATDTVNVTLTLTDAS
jgi:hypothetical protein